jgi:hypothetical protein
MGFFSPDRKIHGKDITLGSLLPVQNSQLSIQRRRMFALYLMHFGNTALRRPIPAEKKEVSSGASKIRN